MATKANSKQKSKGTKPQKASPQVATRSKDHAKKLSALDAAARVLGESKEPMNCPQMIEAMAAKGYWTVSVRSRANPSTLQADRNRRRRAARWSGKPCRWAWTEHTKGSAPWAPCFVRSAFHAARSAKVDPSHQSGTRREFPPFVVPRRRRRCGRVTSTTTSSNCRFAISDTRRPQQHARRTITRLRWTFAERAARGARSARTAASSRRVRRRVWSRFQVESAGMVTSGFEGGKDAFTGGATLMSIRGGLEGKGNGHDPEKGSLLAASHLDRMFAS
jgi:hypothetical protein